jgi:DNA modification methylase
LKDVWHISANDGGRISGHPCPYPIKIPTRLIKLFSSPGNIIGDPFAGSGTTGVAAKQHGRQFILIDTEEKYCKIAVQRLAQEILI